MFRLILNSRTFNVRNASTIKKPIGMRQSERPKDKGYVILVLPVAAFGLGVWQVKRLYWKMDLVEQMEKKIQTPAIDFPIDYEDLKNMEYQAVRVRGRFDHTQEIHIGPRANFVQQTSHQGLGMKSQSGVHVVTPFILADRNTRILVNRGFVPRGKIDPSCRLEGQIGGEVEFVGVVRHTDKRQQFAPENNPKKNQWYYRDLNAMSELLNTETVLIDADIKSSVPGGPIGGQTRVSLRNEHMSYIITWFSLSALTSLGWYVKYIKK